MTLKYLSVQREDHIMELLEELHGDESFKHEINVIHRNEFANIIAIWNETKYDITQYFSNDKDDCKKIEYSTQNDGQQILEEEEEEEEEM